MKAFQINSADGIDALTLNEIEEPRPGRHEVLVRVRASSINYRDLLTVENPEARGLSYPRIPNSDGAGEVVEIGSDVTRFKVGERVCGIFFQTWMGGDITANDMNNALGGSAEGMLVEYRVLHEDGLVATPTHMSDAEAATLPCAAVTAWNSLMCGGVSAGSTVLLLGTGGVSVIALQLCQILGARAVITSSSDEKLERARSLGAWQTVNYREMPEWQDEVLALTDGRGVDHTVEVGGPGTLQKSIAATRLAGSVGMIGVLALGQIDPLPILGKSLRVQGIYVGSRQMFEDMNRALSMHEVKPVIDATYDLQDARQAYQAMRAAKHFGKLVITL
ncbi:MAG TPA: NAD(P)-dependent alcohol dehydrogenase [Sneathiellales bacterium]|nr:NAD(P)-dependent alcohol dehydrogenase [Sneathiellales bacterium]